MAEELKPGGLAQRGRHGETLTIDARRLGTLIDPVHRELTDADFQKVVTTAGIAAPGRVLTPGRHVGAKEVVDDGKPCGQRLERRRIEFERQFEDSARLEALIRAELESVVPREKP